MKKILKVWTLFAISLMLANTSIATAEATVASVQRDFVPQQFILNNLLIELDHGFEPISGDYKIALQQVLTAGNSIYQERSGYQPDIKLMTKEGREILYAINTSTPTVNVDGDKVWQGRFSYELIIPATELKQNGFAEADTLEVGLRIIYPICNKYCISEILQTTLQLSSGYIAPDSILVQQVLPVTQQIPEKSIGMILMFALLGGFLLNLMPCVFPVLSLKIVSVIKLGSKKRHLYLAMLSSSLGIILSFTVLGCVITLLHQAGKIAGWGMHFQNIYLLLFLLVMITLFAGAFLQILHINYNPVVNFFSRHLPGSYSKQGKLKVSLMVENFFAGITIVLLSTPCSAPFLGIATSFALLHPSYMIIPIFTMVGIGIAAPYLLIMLFPQILNIIPKPGKWLQVMEKLMGLVLLATVAWLLSLVYQLSNWIICFKVVVLLVLLLCYQRVMQWLAIPTKHVVMLRRVFFVLIIACLAFLPTTARYQDRRPKVTVQDDLWQPFTAERLRTALQQQRIVLVNITADWCLTCALNEKNVFSHKEFKKILARYPQIIAIRGDLTNANAEVNGYLQSRQHFSLPYTVIYGSKYPQGIALPELLSLQKLREVLAKVLP